ncbi:hypothetical protein GE21DRAFT_8461 [Neurospora crassa]|uniref:Uncharacterized protein n=1 Tax=Neurospora crassa (strain ATCC 24698 / 74-OR23-1A / CBS 708.71 / DSM 1257 / FGSC 987) TaxID=367110 RepID=Q7RZ06_NEUCR|nr:hypothetical protein NCU07219 [Neurospora crassa OR74A]EAA28208.3 hypothetical protein NCU07219 [Neurospora crassa OR74A]KHE85749.1 hypothetical protein GE21DRAFT_8461 [Neurospora crassa]|eukprot:XP_957444.3 hypothetical protein NCU07219 [Neurospora crassa OR74A]
MPTNPELTQDTHKIITLTPNVTLFRGTLDKDVLVHPTVPRREQPTGGIFWGVISIVGSARIDVEGAFHLCRVKTPPVWDVHINRDVQNHYNQKRQSPFT